MITRSAGQGANHAGTAEAKDINGADYSARGEEDHVHEVGMRAAQADWTV